MTRPGPPSPPVPPVPAGPPGVGPPPPVPALAPLEPLTPDRRRAMTRQHLLDAAAIVFAEKGFHGATIDEIAARAGFTKGAVYSNFKSKDDLFLALLYDRVDRQFAVTAEILDTGSHDMAEQFPRIRQMFQGGLFFDETFTTLFLEFVLYSRRNPEARDKLAAGARRARQQVSELIEREYRASPGEPKYPTAHLASMSIALFNGLGLERVVDPEAIDDEMLDTTLAFLYDSMSVDGFDPDAAG